jgi:LAS superfamily LD-carboxypeptidase LdcB
MIAYVPVTMPADLKGQANGKLGPCSLESVYFPAVGHLSLHPHAARSWNLMAGICFAETGVKLSTTGTYRTYEQQLRLFQARYTDSYLPIRNVTTSQRTWQGKTWYLRRGNAPAAAPGTSNHGWALAIDTAIAKTSWDAAAQKNVTKIVGITSDLKAWNWLVANAVAYGWSWEGTKVAPDWKPGQPAAAGWEPWHLRYVAGDVTPKRILDVEAWLAAAAQAPK